MEYKEQRDKVEGIVTKRERGKKWWRKKSWHEKIEGQYEMNKIYNSTYSREAKKGQLLYSLHCVQNSLHN